MELAEPFEGVLFEGAKGSGGHLSPVEAIIPTALSDVAQKRIAGKVTDVCFVIKIKRIGNAIIALFEIRNANNSGTFPGTDILATAIVWMLSQLVREVKSVRKTSIATQRQEFLRNGLVKMLVQVPTLGR